MTFNLPFDCEKGGKSAPKQLPQVAPTPPVEEASVDVDSDDVNKKKTGKGSLKIPLARDISGSGLRS